MRFRILIIFSLLANTLSAQTWVDTLDVFMRDVYRPAYEYNWTWTNAPLLHACELQYEMMPEAERDGYLEYVREAMDRNLIIANGIFPNGVASANGLAFLYRITGEQIYFDVASRVYMDYRNILRTSNGGVSHLPYTPELWDDTIYMIGVFMLAMYRATGNEMYITELTDQIRAHREKLLDETWGLWVHAWDGDNEFDIDFCSQPDWADEETRRSSELWGRGNGWVIVMLSELLNNLPADHEERQFVEETLLEMIVTLPGLQDELTGHWYQLPVREDESGNFLESSCTAMFGYGILTALKYGLVTGEMYREVVDRVYHGLRDHSVVPIVRNDIDHLISANVCGETCIGDKYYYYEREVVNGKAYALAMFVIFGRAYEEMYIDLPTPVVENMAGGLEFKAFPTVITGSDVVNLQIHSPTDLVLQMELTDMAGHIVQHRSLRLEPGANNAGLSPGNLSAGHYFLLFRGSSGAVYNTIPISIR